VCTGRHMAFQQTPVRLVAAAKAAPMDWPLVHMVLGPPERVAARPVPEGRLRATKARLRMSLLLTRMGWVRR
jgi:hypothetical protein